MMYDHNGRLVLEAQGWRVELPMEESARLLLGLLSGHAAIAFSGPIQALAQQPRIPGGPTTIRVSRETIYPGTRETLFETSAGAREINAAANAVGARLESLASQLAGAGRREEVHSAY